MYVVIPIFVFNWIIVLKTNSILKQFIPSIEIRILLELLSTYIYYKSYKWTMSILFGRLHFNLKDEWINYLTFKGWKIQYYKELLPLLSIFNSFNSYFCKATDLLGDFYILLHKASTFVLIFLVYFLGCSVVCAHYEKSIYGFDVWKSGILLNYAKNFNYELVNLIAFFVFSLIFTFFVLFMLGSLLAFISIRLIQCIFPMTNRIADASDVPISFMKKAIEELECFDFSDDFGRKQDIKNHITQSISYALYFLKVNEGAKDLDYLNICYILYAGHLSKAARNDVLFRTNGLYKKIDELCIKINNMNGPEDKILILQNLKMYLKIIEDRDLSKIEGIPYTIKELYLPIFLVDIITILKNIVL